LRRVLRKKEETILVLDIGTEAVKALIFAKNKEGFNFLANSLEYFERFGTFNTFSFEREVLERTVSKAITQAENRAGRKPEKILMTLPPNIFKARIVFQTHTRKDPQKLITESEGKEILKLLFEKSKKEIARAILTEQGISPKDIRFLYQKIFQIKIDGYQVPDFKGYRGKNIDFNILSAFLPKSYSEGIENFLRNLGFKDIKLINQIEGLILYLKEKKDIIFLDIGGITTQIFLTKAGTIEKIEEAAAGGEIFSQSLSERLGLTSQEARILKERYAKNELTAESQSRIKEILSFAFSNWHNLLKDKLKKINPTGFLFPDIWIFGGGSMLPEIKKISEKESRENFSFSNKSSLKIFYPKDIVKKIVGEAAIDGKALKSLSNPQYTTSFLIFYNTYAP